VCKIVENALPDDFCSADLCANSTELVRLHRRAVLEITVFSGRNGDKYLD
jgi:hypothetical protein